MTQAAAANPAPEELVLEYQPVDAAGNARGKKTVIKGATWEEIARKQVEVNLQAQRAMFSIRDAASQKREEPQVSTLTAEEEVQLAIQLNDPAKARAALRKLTGMDQIEQEMKEAREARASQKRAQVAYEWMAARPDFFNCDANGAIIKDYLDSNQLEWTFDNLDKAFAMKQDELASRPVATPQAEANPAPPARRPQATPDIRPGELNGTPAPKSKGLTKADYLKMAVKDPKEYERHMTNTVLRRALDKALGS